MLFKTSLQLLVDITIFIVVLGPREIKNMINQNSNVRTKYEII